jgi:hypothetical protein
VTLVAAGHVAQDEAKISRGSIQTAQPPRSACESSEMMGSPEGGDWHSLDNPSQSNIFLFSKQKGKKMISHFVPAARIQTD